MPTRSGPCGDGAHERNSLVYWVSCRSDARSERKAQPPRSSSAAVRSANAASAWTCGTSAAMTRWPSVWPTIAEPHGGRDEVRDEGETERLEGSARAGCRGRPPRRRPRPDRRPARTTRSQEAADRRRRARLRSDRGDEGVALRRRLEPALGGGGERQREFGDLGEPSASPAERRGRPPRIGSRRCGPSRRREGCRASPRGSPRPSDHRPRAAHSSPCE